MPNLDDYKTEHLFLLIGRNPLPNYVAAKLLIKQGAKVYFVYSEKTDDSSGTQDYKKRLVDKLKMQLGKDFFSPIDVPLVNPSDAACVRDAIKNQFTNIPNNSSASLNYTGGTKAMSVHAYRAIEEFGEKKSCQLKFSYLDPRELKLRFDDNTESLELNQPQTELFKNTKILLGDLMNLHDLIYLKTESGNSVKPKASPLFPKLYEAILKFQSGSKLSSWLDWRRYNRSILEEPNASSEIEIPVELSELSMALNQTSQQVCQTDWVESNKLKFAKVGANLATVVGNFIFSFWLESYVLSKIIEIKDSCGLNENSFGRGLAVVRSYTTDKTEPFFEVDVFAIRGYQLFAIACTVDSRKRMCKHKLFEIVHRAKQLGGDEARIGLACMASSSVVSEIERELEEDHIKVFGKNDLEKWKTDLSELAKWLKGK